MSSHPDMYNEQPSPSEQLIQRCVIIQRDERGYGLTVTGDNPVFVQSVKSMGAAHRAGVQTGDRIIKVNGTLVTSSNHVEVVKMIKSGSYVALTLLGRPLGSTNPTSPPTQPPGPHPGIVRNSDSRRTVTSPQPATSHQDAQAKTERLNTLKRMLEQERTLLDGSTTSSAVTPLSPQTPSNTIIEAPFNTAALTTDHVNMNEEFQTIPEEKKNEKVGEARRPWLPQGISHTRQRSSPETYNRVPGQSPDRLRSITGLKRNNSDAQAKEASRRKYRESASGTREPLDAGKKNKKGLEAVGRTKSLPGEAMDTEFEEVDDATTPQVVTEIEAVTPVEGVEEASVLTPDMATLNMVKICNPPLVAEVHQVQAPGVSQPQGQKDIMCMDEDDFQSDNEAFEEHGPFNDLEQLEKKPAHMSVFIHYLISNSDPSSLFFYIVTDSYASGNLKEMKKWVYDIFSTFLSIQGPLRIQLTESIVNSIEHTINMQKDNEEAMRNVFIAARSVAKEEVEELLADFRQKRALGLGSIFGDQYLSSDDMDRAQELKIVESTLLPHLDRLTTLEAEKEQKNQALAAALNTFMKQVGVKVQNNSPLERAASFMNKDKRGPLKFPRSKKHSQKGHQFTEHQFLNAAFCNQCNGLLWGIGYQGFQCQYCEFNVHRTGPCLDKITSECPGKKKNRKTRPLRTTVNTGKDEPKTAYPLSPQPNVVHLKTEDDELAQVSKNIDVNNMVYQFERPECLGGSKVSIADSGISSLSSDTLPGSVSNIDDPRDNLAPKKKNTIQRSESLKSKGEKKRKTSESKRSRSDVDMDGQSVATVISSSQASSSSSLSTKSQDSPRTSLEQLSKPVEDDDSDMEAESTTPHWQKMIDKDIYKKLKPKEVKRQEVINELFHTEKTHVRNLKVLQRVFFLPMLNQDILKRETVNYIFPNIDEMIEVHGALNAAMKKERKTSHVIQEVSHLLLERFDGEAGETMKRVCANFCQNQSIALEHLKKLTKKEKEKEKDKKEGSLSKFLEDAASNPLCRRLPLPAVIATGYQRLTKYPLLIENLLKYTTAKSPEHEKLVLAHEKSKEILSFVNQAVKESENRYRLLDYNFRMDKTPLEKSNNQLVMDYKNFDLSAHKMIHDGVLLWKINRSKSIDVQVLLLEDVIVLLQRQDEKLILKLHSMTNQMREADKTHSPVIKLSTILCRAVATNKKAFFLVSTASAAGPQIYELIASTTQERSQWMEVVRSTQDAERKQNKGIRRNARTTVNQRTLPPDLRPLDEEEIKSDDKPNVVEPPAVVIAPQPVVVTQSSPGPADEKPIELEPTGDIRTTLEQTIKQMPPENTNLEEQIQSLMLLTLRMKPVLDEAVGDSSENSILTEAFDVLNKQLSSISEWQRVKEFEIEKVKQENQALQMDHDEMIADQERLQQELTMTRHELDNLQITDERPQSHPSASVDSIPDVVDQERLTVQQSNRRSYSGDSSATESEDSKTVESSEPEEPTVVLEVESKSLLEHDMDVLVLQPEVFQANAMVVNPVVNEQLLDLHSAAVSEIESERTEGNVESTKDAETIDQEDNGEAADGAVMENGKEELKGDDSLEDTGYQGDCDNQDTGVAIDVEEENLEKVVPTESDSTVDENRNLGHVVEVTVEGDRTSEWTENVASPSKGVVPPGTEEVHLQGYGDGGQEIQLTDPPSLIATNATDSSSPDVDAIRDDKPNSCLINVIDNELINSGDLILNIEKSDEKIEQCPEEKKLETTQTLDKADTIPTDTSAPRQMQLDVPEGSSRPASLISVDSASSDALLGDTEESDDVECDGETPTSEGSKSQGDQPCKSPLIQETEPEMV